MHAMTHHLANAVPTLASTTTGAATTVEQQIPSDSEGIRFIGALLPRAGCLTAHRARLRRPQSHVTEL